MRFPSSSECEEHEVSCSTIETRWCYKCGKYEEWDSKDELAFMHDERWHHIDLGRPGYGSSLDGCEVNFMICDDCLYAFVDSFVIEGQEKIHNSGSNADLPTDIWIKEAKGELTDEEYEECGMYSPRQIKVYQERFPQCKHVSIVEQGNNRFSRCPYGAFGDSDGNADELNACSECFNCQAFKIRDGDIQKTNYDL